MIDRFDAAVAAALAGVAGAVVPAWHEAGDYWYLRFGIAIVAATATIRLLFAR